MASQGRVEMFHSGIWGTVCVDYWDLKDATVVCRQLGFEGAVTATSSSDFGGESQRKRWMDNVDCVGNETSLTECSHNGWGKIYCSNSEDAAVRCIAGD